jgi:hypothetical protein
MVYHTPGMTVFKPLDGTLCSTFTIGLRGPTIWQGQTEPVDSLGQDGDLYVVQNATGGFFKKLLGAWTPIATQPAISYVEVLRGINLTVSVNDTVVAVIRNPFTIDSQDTTIDSEEVTIDADALLSTTITFANGAEGEAVVIKDETGLGGELPCSISSTPAVNGELWDDKYAYAPPRCPPVFP